MLGSAPHIKKYITRCSAPIIDAKSNNVIFTICFSLTPDILGNNSDILTEKNLFTKKY